MKQFISLIIHRTFLGHSLNTLLRATFVCFLLLLLPAHTDCATAAEFSIGIGGSASSTPYKDYGVQWMPLPLVSLESDYAYIRGYTVGVKLLNLEFLKFSVFGGYDGMNFKASDSSDRRLQALDNRHSSAVAGMETRLLTPYGMLHANAARDILSNSKGWNGTIGYAYSVELEELEIIATAGLHWANGNYHNYYYGISNKEAQKSGLHAYKAGAGFSPYLGLTLDYSLNDAWEIFCSGTVNFLNSKIKNSPMVDKHRTWNIAVGIMYNF